MKFKIEVELDWIDEESNLDDNVKDLVVSKLVKSVQEKMNDSVVKQVDAALKPHLDKIETKVNDLVQGTYDEMIDKDVQVTDQYGDVIKSINVKKIVKDKWERFLTEQVDEYGKASNYSSKGTRINHIVDKQIKQMSEEFTKKAVQTVKDNIKNYVKDGITEKLGKELMHVLKVDKMLELPKS